MIGPLLCREQPLRMPFTDAMTIEREYPPPRHVAVEVEKEKILRQSEMENRIGLSMIHGAGEGFPAEFFTVMSPQRSG